MLNVISMHNHKFRFYLQDPPYFYNFHFLSAVNKIYSVIVVLINEAG